MLSREVRGFAGHMDTDPPHTACHSACHCSIQLRGRWHGAGRRQLPAATCVCLLALTLGITSASKLPLPHL